jgi:hypothetical protein
LCLNAEDSLSLLCLQIVVLFIRLALVGAALGFGFGMATSFWLANIWNDPGTA